MSNIVLIGMPGAGKSTVGVLLAKALQRPFLDTDLFVQVQAGQALQQIINEQGMEAFLDIEAHAICGLDLQRHVIATGGSVVCRERAMAHLRAQGTIIFLALPYNEVERRLHNITTRGIAMQPGSTLRDLYHDRQPLYAQYADITIEADGLTLEETVTKVAQTCAHLDRRQGER